jgi:hypothetical protein
MTDFVLVPGEQLGVGHLDWAFEFSRSEKETSPFQLALSAAGLAAYGAKMKTKSLVPLVHQQYARCLKAINSALISRDAAMDDSILAAILLLVVFEVSLEQALG